MISNQPDKQELALTQLVFGGGIAQAARVAGVDRATIYRWLREDPAFARQIRAARHDAHEAAWLELIGVAPAALQVVKYAIDDEDVGAALKVAQAMRLLHRLETAEAELMNAPANDSDAPPT